MNIVMIYRYMSNKNVLNNIYLYFVTEINNARTQSYQNFICT